MYMCYLALFAVLPLVAYSAADYSDPYAHPCNRKCEENGKPMTCVHNFTLEWYQTMSKACKKCPLVLEDCSLPECIPADGWGRAVLVVNRQIPSPPIIVCEKDEVVVNVHNKLHVETASVHWHGIHHRDGLAYMDGVPFVTQCPIQPNSYFQYRFTANPGGTLFYHSHSGTQRMDGMAGALIVRQTNASDPHTGLYDHDLPEHTLIMQEWLKDIGNIRFNAHYQDPINGNMQNKPRNIIINGKGVYEGFTDPATNKIVNTPREVFTVTQGQRYRFRTINTGSINCPLILSVDGHRLLIIASDGQSMEPFEVDSLIVYAGERYDFVLTADQKIDNYWVKVKGDRNCINRGASQAAILRYNGTIEVDPAGSTAYENMDREGVRLNPLYDAPPNISFPIGQMNATAPDDITSKPKADVIYYVGFKKMTYDYNGPRSSSPIYKRYVFNNISLMLPISPLLYQYHDTPQDMFCDSSKMQDCIDKYCECVNILHVRIGQVAEIVVVSEPGKPVAAHPMHLHGYTYRVVAEGKIGENISVPLVKQMDMEGKIKRKLSHAVIKDTVFVPALGYSVLRFYADNPGIWLFHCHVEFHAEVGMALLVQVGEPKDFPGVPDSFPRCGSYPGDWNKKKTPPKQDECKPIFTGSSVRPLPTSVFFITVFVIITNLMTG